MKESFVKLNVDEKSNVASYEVSGRGFELLAMAVFTVRAICEETGDSIDLVTETIREIAKKGEF